MAPSCAGNLKPVLVMYGETKLGGGGQGQQSFPGTTLAACSQACSSNKVGDGERGDIGLVIPVWIFSRRLEPPISRVRGSSTTQHPRRVRRTRLSIQQPTQAIRRRPSIRRTALIVRRMTFWSQRVLKSGLCVLGAQACQSPFQFEAVPQKILVGFARLVVPSSGPNDCLKVGSTRAVVDSYQDQSPLSVLPRQLHIERFRMPIGHVLSERPGMHSECGEQIQKARSVRR